MKRLSISQFKNTVRKMIKIKRQRVNFFNLYMYSLKIGFKAIGKGILTKESVKRILCPMDPDRYYELPRVGSSLKLAPGSKVLDISSPKLLVYFLAEKYPNVTFYSVEGYETELKSWNKLMGKKPNVIPEIQDARKLKYKQDFFDEIFSVSVIEHIMDKRANGDSEMVKETYRVLKKGGQFVFTSVADKKFRKVYLKNDIYSDNSNRLSFFERVYSYKSLKKRILDVTRYIKKEEEISYFRFPIYVKVFNSLIPWSAILGFLNLFIVPWNIMINKIGDTIVRKSVYFCVLKKNEQK